MIDAAAHLAGRRLDSSWSRLTIQTVSLAGPAGHAFRFVTVFIMAAMLGSYVEFLRDSKPQSALERPSCDVFSWRASVKHPLPTSLHGQNHSLEETPDGMVLYRFGQMGDAYSIGAGRRSLMRSEVEEFKLSNLLEEVSTALEKASTQDDFVMKEKPRAVSHGAEWAEVGLSAPCRAC